MPTQPRSLRHGDEIVEGPLSVFSQGRSMPLGAELAPSTDLSQHVSTLPVQPRRSQDSIVIRRHGGSVPAVPVENGQIEAIELHAAWVHDEVGDSGTGQGIDVQERFPIGVPAGTRAKRRAPPEPPLVLLVLQEILSIPVPDLRGADAFLGAVDLQGFVVDRIEDGLRG